MEKSSHPEIIEAHRIKGSGGDQIPPKTLENFRETIMALPKHDSWTPMLSYYQYQGFWYSSFFLEGLISAQKHFKPNPNDTFLCSPPKSGTTWLKALSFAIATRTTFDDFSNPLLKKVPHECIPYLEIDFGQNPNTQPQEPPQVPLLATHVPFTSLPASITSSGCKIVYICREPKDAFVSHWHFVRKLTPSRLQPIGLEDAHEMFCKGVSEFGSYWEHVSGYWKASQEYPEKVLFLKYEDLLVDTAFYVKRLAEFIGHPFSIEEEKNGEVAKIVKLCSFESLSNLEVNKTGKHGPWIENNSYFRKGKTGDWKNYLTDEMAKQMNDITEQKFSGTGFTFDVSSEISNAHPRK